ncbi:MAG: enoyl-CoA hydratase/carnithine racemase [Ilumatobacteraceae bacterium]|nr:enoyl-CoA hydratase/carnithine racemase [Ilumatobacteraceae bacterium]
MTSVGQLPAELSVEIDGAVRIVTLNRPAQHNATNAALHAALAHVWSDIERDSTARAVVLTGAGPSFCAGGDLEWLERIAVDEEERRRVLLEARKIVIGMADFGLPVVAAVNGPAVGLGFSLAMLCDLVYMSETAYFADPHVGIGLVAADGVAMVLPHLMGLMRVRELLLLGGRIDAREAVELGLATAVNATADVLPAALAVAKTLAALPARACQETKRALNRGLVLGIMSTIDHALAAESECFTSIEHSTALDRLRRR